MASATPQQPEAREPAADEEEAEPEIPQVARLIQLCNCLLILFYFFGKIVLKPPKPASHLQNPCR